MLNVMKLPSYQLSMNRRLILDFSRFSSLHQAQLSVEIWWHTKKISRGPSTEAGCSKCIYNSTWPPPTCGLHVLHWKLPSRHYFIVLRSFENELPVSLSLSLCHVAIGNPERHVRKASHCGSKQQYRSCPQSLLLLLARATYVMVLFFTHIPFVVNHTINATPLERLQQSQLRRKRIHKLFERDQYLSLVNISTHKPYTAYVNRKKITIFGQVARSVFNVST